MKGDKITVVVDLGGGGGVAAGATDKWEMVATKAGRTVEVSGPTRGMISVSECKRNGGEKVRTFLFMASRVIALIEDKQDPEPEVQETLALDA